MKRHFFILCAVVLFLVVCASLGFAGAPRKIISLKPNITDIVYALGLGENLAGVTKYCDVPSGAKKPQIIADYTHPHMERIIALMPDVVLGSEENSSRLSIETIRGLGIDTQLFSFSNIEETLESIKKIGDVLGVSQKGLELANKFESGLSSLKKKWGTVPLKKVWVVWGVRPIVVAGQKTYMSELLGYITLKNVAKDSKVKYPRIGIEEMIASDADVIVDLAMGSESLISRPWDGIAQIKAVKNGRVIVMDASRLRAGPGLPAALDELAGRVHNGSTSDIQKVVGR